MPTRQNFELISICIVSALLIIFASLYFVGTKKRKNLRAAIKNSDDLYKNYNRELDEFVENMRIMTAQLDLLFELGPVFTVCYDYIQNFFYISENGQSQLGFGELDGGEADQKKFESLIHGEDLSLYEEVTDFEDIRKREIADSPYIIRLKGQGESYKNYLMRVRPIYDEDGINKAIVAAFINTDYIAK
ncbi:MAG: hypothetical protein FWD23_10670 [Oscillospiraceae bacterium]|nr:hypothetical protein [Oscillospiraceae bacterium]